MTRRAPLSVLILAWTCSNAALVHAQATPPLWIRSVTIDAPATTATITGTGFGQTRDVTLDGHLLTVLPGASATQLVVAVPAATLATPGTYRLTIADATGRMDTFEVTLATTDAGGVRAVVENSGAPYNTTIGYQALNSLTTGESNLGAGYQALFANTSGSFNTATGLGALYNTTTGSRNAAHGYQALSGNNTGTDNTAVGYQALFSGGALGNTAVGASALFSNTGSYNTAVGRQALSANTGGSENTAVGYQALFSGGISGNTAVGSFALYGATGSFNTAMGRAALQLSTGSSNAAFGNYALGSSTTAATNTAVGANALALNTSGSGNTAVGFGAQYNGNGCCNTALGYWAGGNGSTGHYNIHVGTNVFGTEQDTNLIRIGKPYNPVDTPPSGQNRTFIAGIRGTSVTGATPVAVNADGQLGMADKLGAGAGYGCATCYQAGTIELYNLSTGDLNIQSGPSYRTMLNPNGGNVGVGVTALFGAGAGFGCASCYQAGYLQFYNPNTGHLTLQSGSAFDTLLNPYGGNVGIGVADAVHPLHMASGAHVTAGGVWTNASSRALKDHITPLTLERAQEALLALAPVEYTYKADPTQHHVGFIAEDVPAVVAQNDRASLSPMDLVGVLTKVAQSQEARIAALEVQNERIAGLEAQLAALQRTVAALQAQRPPQP